MANACITPLLGFSPKPFPIEEGEKNFEKRKKILKFEIIFSQN
jgi:hypothetical protein